MKTVLALMIGLGLALAANTAYATPAGIDPSVIINKAGDPTCDPTTTVCFSANSITDPLVITLDSQGLAPLEPFEYTGATTLNTLYVQLNGALPLEVFDCVSDIFTGCGSFNTGISNDDGLIFENGVLSANEEFTVQVSAPEPQSWILLALSMLGVFMLGMKYWEPSRSV